MRTESQPPGHRRPRRVLAARFPSRFAALLLLLSAAAAGCAGLQPASQGRTADGGGGGGTVLPGTDAFRLAPPQLSGQATPEQEPRYLRFRTEETQLVGAQDDGRYTYLDFQSTVGADLELFDQDGRPLASASAGRVAIVQGLHAGILVRRGERASFVSPNPRAMFLPRQPLQQSADHAEARARLENQPGQLQAMQRALDAARLAVAAAGTRRGAERPPDSSHALSGSNPATRLQDTGSGPWPGSAMPATGANPSIADGNPRLRHHPQVLRALQPDASEAVRLPAAPLAAANASASAPERGLVRVFFATASRSIVAPEDGLGLLLREAGKADEIRVTGFTDATGSRSSNEALALARADAVVQVLLRRGIPPERIFSSGVGADEYIADNASERGRALNRRVEVLLLRNGVPLPLGGAARAMR